MVEFLMYDICTGNCSNQSKRLRISGLPGVVFAVPGASHGHAVRNDTSWMSAESHENPWETHLSAGKLARELSAGKLAREPRAVGALHVWELVVVLNTLRTLHTACP